MYKLTRLIGYGGVAGYLYGTNQVYMNVHISSNNILKQEEVTEKKPSVVLVLPFNPKMTPRQVLEKSLRASLEQAERELLSLHPAEEALPVIRKLQELIRGLNFSTLRRSVAVFVSETVGQVYYMDMEVEGQVLVDQPFRVRDIGQCRQKATEYLVLVLSARQSRMYRGIGNELQLIKSNVAQNIYAYVNEAPERTANFSDPDARREVTLGKFLHHMDHGLGAVLKVYSLPVFVIGASRVVGHFASITHNEKNIAAYVHKNCLDNDDVMEHLRPELDNWQKLRQRLIQRQIEKAMAAGKLVSGVEEVRKAAACKNSRLLVIGTSENEEGVFYQNGVIDEIAGKVLENGGNVELVEPGILADHGGVVIIRYY